MNQIEQITAWFDGLDQREQTMVSIAGVLVVITLIYLILWEPLQQDLRSEREKLASNGSTIGWMKQAAQEARTLRASGSRTSIRNANAPVSLSIEQTVATSGLKDKLNKLESSGKDSARVKLENAPFNQVIVWLNTLEKNFGIATSSISIERTDSPGLINARLNLSRER